MTLAVVRLAQPMPLHPELTALSRPFWEALDSAIWVQSYCENCDVWRFPPPARNCPTCQHKLEWRSAPRFGTLYALTTVHAAPAPFSSLAPYAIGLVELSNGLRMLSPIISAPRAPAPGESVEVVQVSYSDGSGYACRLAQAPP